MPGALVVGQLVDQDQLRPLRQRRLEIELDQLRAAIGHFLAREHVEPQHQRLGLGPDVRLDVADQHVDAFAGLLATGLEHGVGLADAGRRAEKDLQLAARFLGLFGLHAEQQGIGIASTVVHFRSAGSSKITPIGLTDYLILSKSRFKVTTLTRSSPSSPNVRNVVCLATSSRTLILFAARALWPLAKPDTRRRPD